MENKRKVIFDTDIGDDDAVALAACLLADNINIIGITTVQGNLPIEMSTDNALRVVELFKKDIPVFKGCKKPLVRAINKGRDYNTLMETVKVVIDGKLVRIHSEKLPIPGPTKTIEKAHACSFIVDTLRSATEKIDICAIGPLTNIATAIIMDQEIVNNIGTIYIMGGGLYKGNRTPVAEANFYDDPEAAEIVLTSGANCIVCPVEPCEMAATYNRQDAENIKDINNPISKFLYDTISAYIQHDKDLFGGADDCTIYDYAAVAPLIDPNVIIEVRDDIAHVDFHGGMADGQLVIDRRGFNKWQPNAKIIYQEDADKVHQLLLNLLKKYH